MDRDVLVSGEDLIVESRVVIVPAVRGQRIEIERFSVK